MTKQLLAGRFIPATDIIGFLEAPFDRLVDKFAAWLGGIRRTIDHVVFESDLAGALQRLEPLNTWPTLLVETPSPWVTVFNQGDPGSATRHNAKTFPCRGVLVTCVEDTFDARSRNGRPGGVQFCMYGGPNADSELNVARVIYALAGYEADWHEYGQRLPFEEPERYASRRIRDRFTPKMLERYCAALGIRLFDESFYGPRCALFYDTEPLPPEVPPDTFEKVHKRLGIGSSTGPTTSSAG